MQQRRQGPRRFLAKLLYTGRRLCLWIESSKFSFQTRLSGIFSLVQGELQNGPRKEFVANKTFKEVFDEEWILQVLGEDAPCSPIGWRGFMLGKGLIWYNKADDGWAIFP